MVEQLLYSPRRLVHPSSGYYTGTLGKFEFEDIATGIITRSRVSGSWQPVRFSDPSRATDAIEMMRRGFLRRTKDGSYFLTNLALERIVEKYSRN